MDDSMINPILLSSSMHLHNAEKLIKNLETITTNDERFLLESIQSPNEYLSIDSFLEQTPMYPPSSSSATSWKQMKESHRIINENSSKEISSPLNLYKIFRRKSTNIITHQFTPSYLHKSLPDLSFVAHYTKQIPRSLNTSPLLQTSSSSETNIARTTPSPTLIHQHKSDTDRPRTLKSIKRYKNSKHTTDPFNVSYSSISPETDLCQSSPSMSRCQSKLFEKDHLIFFV